MKFLSSSIFIFAISALKKSAMTSRNVFFILIFLLCFELHSQFKFFVITENKTCVSMEPVIFTHSNTLLDRFPFISWG